MIVDVLKTTEYVEGRHKHKCKKTIYIKHDNTFSRCPSNKASSWIICPDCLQLFHVAWNNPSSTFIG